MFIWLVTRSFPVFLLLLSIAITNPVLAVGFGPMPISLKNVPIPPVPGLLDGNDPIVINKDSAIALGKALFWDTSIGSDGQACASCHFQAGSDARTKNQLAPGGKFSTLPTAQTFEATASGHLGGPNYQVKSSDFPFFKLADPLDPSSSILFQSDDVLGSSGSFGGLFSAVLPNDFSLLATDSNDQCLRAADANFHVGALGTRKVTPRNTPTVINAIFNYRNFWDGRANNVFNGSSPWGDRDPNAGVWVKTSNTSLQKLRLELINSSVASVAMAPPLNDTEMSCSQRTFKDLGRKLLNRYALATQIVHFEDSALGPYSNSFFFSDPNNLQTGLYYTYHDLVVEAFNPKYWSARPNAVFGKPSAIGAPAYSQMESNFSMF